MTAAITKKQVKRVLVRIAKAAPDRVNPQSSAAGGSCIYTSHDGKHCLVGEVLLAFGLPVPRYRGAQNAVGFKRLSQSARFEPGAVFLLREAQQVADNMGEPLPWKEAVAELKSESIWA